MGINNICHWVIRLKKKKKKHKNVLQKNEKNKT